VPENQKYKAFISYSHADVKWAKWLQRTLETYRTPRRLQGTETRHGIVPASLQPIFRDRDELASSHDLSSSILAALQGSENLIVICSPSAARSKWTTQEVQEFKRLGRSDRIFCLIVDGDPEAAGTDDDCFPPAIRVPFDTRGQQLPGDAEPMAADIREQADGRKLARLKIIAGLLDVGLDDLRRRELQRMNRTLGREAETRAEVGKHYRGTVLFANDLDKFDIGKLTRPPSGQ
jgi:hypothetical protein